MSLILDALKKSEQERRRDTGPDLQTIHQPVVSRAPRRSYGLAWGALLLAVNVGALIYWWQQREPAPVAAATPPVVAAPPAPASTPAPAAAVAVPAPAPVAPPPQGSAVVASEAEFAQITPGGNPAAAGAATDELPIQAVDELPEDVRNNLPAMTFSFHVYSGSPQQRTIIINNRRMREGEEVSPGLVLQQITEDGVILLYERHRIHISVLSGW
jgi:general secretion pathway protein B